MEIIGKQYAELKAEASALNVSLSALLCTLYAKILSLWNSQDELALNLTVFNRIPFHKDVRELIGDFTAIIPLHITFQSGTPLQHSVTAVQKDILLALDHRHFDGIDFIRALARHKNLGTKAVIPFVFTSMLVNYNAGEPLEGLGAFGEIKYGVSRTAQVYIDHQVFGGNMAVPKKWLEKTGGFEENFKGWRLEDAEAGYALYKAGLKIVINSKLEIFHQNHPGSDNLRISKPW